MYKQIANKRKVDYQILITDNDFHRDIFVSSKLRVIDKVAETNMVSLIIPEFRCIMHCLVDIEQIEEAHNMIKSLNKDNMAGSENSLVKSPVPKKFGCTDILDEDYFSQDIINMNTPDKAMKPLIKFKSPSKPLTSSLINGSASCSTILADKEIVRLKKSFSSRTPVKTNSTPNDKKKRFESSPTKSVKVHLEFNLQQMQVLNACLAGANVFFTGGAGTGKSTLLNKIITELNNKHGAGCVFVTATTGLAACNIGGTTIHQFAGIGVMEGTVEDIVREVMKRTTTVRRWKQAKVIR
jgi:hypothetical protein